MHTSKINGPVSGVLSPVGEIMERITPTFLLRGVDPQLVRQRYKEGVYSKMEAPTSTIRLSQAPTLLEPRYGQDSSSPIYSFRDRNNGTLVVATSNHQPYQLYQEKGEVEAGGRCDYCKIDFTQQRVGCPLAMQRKEWTVKEGEEFSTKVTFAFWTEGCYCSFECCLADILRLNSASSLCRDPTYLDAETMLRLLYRLTYPGEEKLLPAQDYRLMAHNGGPLSERDRKHQYRRTGKVLMAPLKVEYMQQSH